MKPDSIDAYHAAREPEDRDICDRLRTIIDKGLKDAESRMWHAHPVWFLSGNPIVGYGKLKDCIRLMFWSGQSFKNPGLSPTGTFKAAEIRYKSVNDVNADVLGPLLAEARDVQWDYKNIVKRKGRLEPLTGL